MQFVNAREMPAQPMDEPLREQSPSVLGTLTPTHDQLVGREVEVLHSQLGAFEQPDPGSVKEFRHQSTRAEHLGKHQLDLVGCQNDRQPDGSLRAGHPLGEVQRGAKNIPIKKKNRGCGLLLR